MPSLSTSLTIRLCPASGGAAPVHGWYLPDNDPAGWLRELLQAGLNLNEARLMVMPGGKGALISIPGETVPSSLPRAVPFTRVRSLLWIPCDAVVSPSLTAEEVAALCPWAAVVWHPAHPPAAFEENDILPVSALIQRPPAHTAFAWTGAVPLDPMLSEVRNIRLALVFDEKSLFGEEEKRIGSEPVKDLPGMQPSGRGNWRDWISAAFSTARKKPARMQTANETSGGRTGRSTLPWWMTLLLGALFVFALAAAAHNPVLFALLVLIALFIVLLMIVSMIRSGLNRTAGKGSSGTRRQSSAGGGEAAAGSSGSGGGGLRGWLHRVSEEMERRRWKAVEELLEDLQRDPDKALRRALPLNSTVMHRGVAAPGDQLLPNRIPEFSLGGLSHGGPVDNWNLPTRYQQQLRVQYVALAQAEARRGNYRAAAYIHAHLLGDLHSAAAALKAGKHYREAATLYRTRLSNNGAAAECLAAAGCHVEAAELYEEMGRDNDAGDAWLNAGDIERAKKAWRRAVREYADRQNPVAAATLLERKLDEPEEALAVLTAAWPGHAQATAALLAAYDLMAQRQWSAPALELTRRICESSLPDSQREPLAKVLTGIARAWPNPLVRDTAKEGALELIAGQFTADNISAVRRAGAILAELESGDKLLTRDIARYTNALVEGEKRRARSAPVRPMAHSSGTKGLIVEHRGVIELQHGWGTAFLAAVAGEGNEAYVLTGADNRRGATIMILAVELHDKKCLIGNAWETTEKLGRPAALTLGPHGVLLITGNPGFPKGLAPVLRAPGKLPLSAGRPSWMHGRDALATVCGDLWCLGSLEPEGIRLDFLDATGQQRQSVVVEYEAWDRPERYLTGLASHGQYVFMAVSGGLMIWHPHNVETEELPSVPMHLAVSPSWARAGVAIGCAQGAYLYWPHSQQCQTLDRDLAEPVVGFTGRSHVIALGKSEGIAAQVDGGSFARFQRFPWTRGKPVAILPHPDGDTFAVLTGDGKLEIVCLREEGR